jgi:hypothetical protein
MDKQTFERRRLLQLCILGTLAAPIAVIGGCARGEENVRRRRGGGSNAGEKSGGNGGGPGGN